VGGRENDILVVIEKEKEKFGEALKEGVRYFEKLIAEKNKKNLPKVIQTQEAFFLYQSYGFPLELTEELAQQKGFEVDRKGFRKAKLEHQEVSRRGAERKFGGF